MKSAFRKLSHSIYPCKYHVVFCPKYRRRIFRGEIADFTGSQIRALLRQKDNIEVLELNVQVDHIHVVLSVEVCGFERDGFSQVGVAFVSAL